MGMWSTFVTGVEAVNTKVVQGVNWTWQNVSLSRVLSYASNTVFGILEQGLALKTAIPSLINNPKSLKILKGMGHVVADALPLMGLNYLNISTQAYFRSGAEKEASWFTAYSVFLSGLTLVDYGVKAFMIRQGAQSLIRVSVLDTLGPVAFTANKKTIPFSPCVDDECSTSRKMKGWLREPFILLSNDVITGAISYIPYVGMPASNVIRVFFNGRYIARKSTPELCERHKVQFIRQESTLGLGLTYELSRLLLDKVLESTVGMPPYLYYRTLSHLLLLLHVNQAAHMKLPLIKPEDATFDPFNFFESMPRFLIDVLVAGLKERIPIDFKPDENAPPLIPLSPALKFGTRLLNRDLDKKPALELRPSQKVANTLWVVVFPPVMQSMDGLIRDPIIALYWPGLRKQVISYVDGLLAVNLSINRLALANHPEATASALYYYYKVPISVTGMALMLSKEKDFDEIIYALKAWFDRHHIDRQIKLPEHLILLHGETRPLSLESAKTTHVIPSAQALTTINRLPAEPLVDTKQLIHPNKTPSASLRMNELISKKGLGVAIKPSDLKPRRGVQNASISENPASLFTRKRRVDEDVHGMTTIDNTI